MALHSQIAGSIAFVSGANRGLGRAFAQALVARGAKVYGGARDPGTIDDAGVIPVQLDITDPKSVAAAVAQCSDTTLLINNAGILRGGGLIGAPNLDGARAEMETNYFGTLEMSRQFAPVLGRNGGGALVNMASVLSWITFPAVGGYAASKSAVWSLTDAIRQELSAQNTLVVGVHAGYIDTDMAANVAEAKVSPEDVVAQVLDAVEAGQEEVLADGLSRAVKAGLGAK
ncbi:SDR family oxidoreductase [Antrihabitans stalactiti]|uniref:SDR family oxidoreductase n=1 Tax=Antrihabitans stalactiti TaxID=2584121 RepID=A0A848KCN1_9NOCA|nr:SDR family oxidoreductase [Antrihabitans stalactiti]NMN95466.1 SDR family oxidoreductase [Antrihabitans stalactiti]